MADIFPVILSGGAGTRLWPVSRPAYPKQFLPLTGVDSLFEDALHRVADPQRFAPVTVICNVDHRFLVAEQVRRQGQESRAIILEPMGRNTAAAATIAALSVLAECTDGLLLIMPSDHLVRDVVGFHAAVDAAAVQARTGRLMTFGLQPLRPETGFGYIELGDALDGGPARTIRRFVEKPDLARAATFVTGGQHVWNSGIFLMRADALMEEMARFEPEVVVNCREAFALGVRDLDFLRLNTEAFKAARSISIDHAVMERTDRAGVVPCEIGWSDLGSWEALWESGPLDDQGNRVTGDVLAIDSHNNLIHADSRLVSTIGIDNMVVVETDTAVLVAPRARAQDVRLAATRLEAANRSEAREHSTVYRPWGTYRSIHQAGGFQVKHITVKPGQSLSLQLHHKRSEHWVVVRGEGKVTRGDAVITLQPNQSTYIPVGMKHRLENTGSVVLEMIEVQCGDYLGEDDIVRFTDVYGRA
jgi:mannose-1-phosphate guanylyltransferase/mannose-6-phosphate isomerase